MQKDPPVRAGPGNAQPDGLRKQRCGNAFHNFARGPKRVPFERRFACYKADIAGSSFSMNLDLHPGQSGSRRRDRRQSSRSSDGAVLRFARFEPPAGRKGTLCMFPGRAEFIEKYFEVVRDARARGFAVAILDWRGQGLSERALANARKGHVRDFSEYDRDLEAFVKEVVLPDCPPPLFALGHSMGAAVLLRAAYHGRRWFDRMVLTGPMIDLAGAAGSTRCAPQRAVHAARWVSAIPTFRAAAARRSTRCRFPATISPRIPCVMRARPRSSRPSQTLGIGSPTVAWVDSAFRAMREFAEPSLCEPCAPAAAARRGRAGPHRLDARDRRVCACGCAPGSHLVIPGARHEILMEQDRYPRAVLGGVRRVRARHAAVLVEPSRSLSSFIAASCTRLSPAATMRPPFAALSPSQVVMTPPAPCDDRDQRHDVVRLQPALDDEIDVARREHAVRIAVAAVARELHLRFDAPKRPRGRRRSSVAGWW